MCIFRRKLGLRLDGQDSITTKKDGDPRSAFVPPDAGKGYAQGHVTGFNNDLLTQANDKPSVNPLHEVGLVK